VNREKEITELEQARLRRLPLLPSLSGAARSAPGSMEPGQ
jgi:hypothetical protein